jgi:hypothetical protein
LKTNAMNIFRPIFYVKRAILSPNFLLKYYKKSSVRPLITKKKLWPTSTFTFLNFIDKPFSRVDQPFLISMAHVARFWTRSKIFQNMFYLQMLQTLPCRKRCW